MARWKYRTKNDVNKSPSAHHRTTLSSYIFATKAYIDNRQNLLKQQYLLHTFSWYGGPLAAEIDWRVWGTPANFNGFRVLASLLQRRRSTEVIHSFIHIRLTLCCLFIVNRTLHDVWPSPGLIYCICIFGGSCP